jgi:hypothetical protein
MKRILSILHCALTLALILILLRVQRAPDADPVAPAVSAPATADLVDEPPVPDDLIAAKDRRIRELEEQLLAASVDEPAVETRATVAPSPPAVAESSAFAKVDQEQSAHARRVADVERKFGDLFFELELSPEDADQLRALLVARKASDDPERLDHEIAKFLGNDGYAYLQWYKKTPKARATVKDIQHKLSARGLAMTGDQAAEMIDIFHRTDTTGSQLGLPQVQSLGDGVMTIQISSGGNAPDIEQGLDQLTNNFHQLLDDAGQVLAENQMDILTQILNQKLRGIESNVKSTGVGGASAGATIEFNATFGTSD